MTQGPEWTDVLIVGGGPVGLALALDLRYRGIDCVVLEAGDGVVRHPKVSTVGPRSMELFRRWGAAQSIRDAGWPADHPLDIAWVTRVGGHEIYRFHRGTAANRPPFAHTPEPDQMCPAHWLNPVLQRAVGVHPEGPLRLRTALEKLLPAADHVEALVTDHTGARHTLRARYAVAGDGANSRVRSACGIEAPARHRSQTFRNILFRAPRLREQLGERAALVHFLLLSDTLRFPMRALNGEDLYNLVVSADATATAAVTAAHDGADPAGSAEVDALSLIRQAIAFDTPVELLNDSSWHLTHRVADRYRSGRVFLVGDAAHTLSPSGGFGLNTGIGDAADLGWKLAAALDGWAGDGLLDTYQEERRPIAVASLEEANLNLRRTMRRQIPAALHQHGPEGERARAEMAERLRHSGAQREFDAPQIHFGLRYRSCAIVEDPDVPVREGPPDDDWRPGSEPGYRAAHAWWGPGVSTLDLYGRGFVLLHFTTASPQLDALKRAFAERGVPLTLAHGQDPSIARLHQRAFVLVRPDGHVAWRGDHLPADPAALADTVRGASS